jgi:hypothetical protein
MDLNIAMSEKQWAVEIAKGVGRALQAMKKMRKHPQLQVITSSLQVRRVID